MPPWAYRKLARLAVLLVAIAGIVAAACGSDDKGNDPTATNLPSTSAATSSVSGGLTVFAAASLTDAFNEAGQAFETANEGVSVEFNFAGSATLVTQLDQGAAADLLATAAQKNMDDALDAGVVVNGGTVFARNKLAVIVPKSNPGDIASPFALANSGLKLVIAQEGVPAGDYARQIFQSMEADPQGGTGFAGDVLGNLVSEEANVKAIVTKVQLGEADAGIVYVTDVTPDVAGDVTMIEIPDTLNVVATYPIAVTADAGNAEGAQAFIDFLLSEEGQAILERHGFIPAT